MQHLAAITCARESAADLLGETGRVLTPANDVSPDGTGGTFEVGDVGGRPAR